MQNNISFKALPVTARTIGEKIIAGPKPTYADLKLLTEEHVSKVIDLRRRTNILQEIKERIFCTILGIKYKKHPMNLIKGLPEISEFKLIDEEISKCAGKVYIHCNKGTHRTNLACMASELLRGKITLTEAIAYLKKNDYMKVGIKNSKEMAIKQKKLENLIKRLDEFIQLFSNKQQKRLS